MAFAVNFDDIRRHVKQTMEFVHILQEEDFPDQNFFDVRPSLKRIRIQNACLDVEELFDLQRSLATIDNVVKFLQRCQDEENTIPSHPYLYALTADVKTYPMLVRRIDQILDKYGHVKDTASPTLLQIRRELAATAGSVSRALQNILKSAKGDGLIDKDVSPTLRDGRLVIPVAPAMKRKIRGIVHDESDTGRTVFIEPAEVVEANNKIRELENEERKEINRILMEFTQTVRPEVEEMLASYEFLAQIDFIRAKARFAILTNSTEPRMENRQVLDWAIAVHPLLDLKFKTLIAPSDSPKGEGNRPDGNTSPLGEDGKGLEGLDIVALYKTFYEKAAFTHYSDKALDLKQVVNTNKALVHVEVFGRKVVITSMIDNLLKGAVGQAVQNMNIMFGIDERAGLNLKASAF